LVRLELGRMVRITSEDSLAKIAKNAKVGVLNF
jgi:hypothetical protein